MAKIYSFAGRCLHGEIEITPVEATIGGGTGGAGGLKPPNLKVGGGGQSPFTFMQLVTHANSSQVSTCDF